MKLYHGTNREITELKRPANRNAACLTEDRVSAEIFACSRVKERGEGQPLVFTFEADPPAVEKIDIGWALRQETIKPNGKGELVDCSKFPPGVI